MLHQICWRYLPKNKLISSSSSSLAYTSMRRRYSQEETCRNPVQLTWMNFLYETSESKDTQLSKLRKQLQVAVSSKRSHEKGDLLPYLVANELRQFYSSISDQEEKATFFRLMSDHLGVQSSDVASSIQKYQASVQRNSQLYHRYKKELANSLIPPYKHLFDDVTKLEKGLAFLVQMRKDLLNLYRSKTLKKKPSLVAFDTCLKEHLAQWFTGGFLDLDRITWEHTSAELLEKIRSYEAVHQIDNWNELKRRLRPGRRVFSFTHRLMPGEPLVILHTALGREIPTNIQTVLTEKNCSDSDVTSACFYSISSTQRGLDGIGLGNLLIKRAVEYLRIAFPQLSTYATLSPVPGFKRWLDGQFALLETNDTLPRHLSKIDGDVFKWRQLQEILSDKLWHEKEENISIVKYSLTNLCYRYLTCEKQRGFAIDPVAHFHLRNGASLWRINFLGNTNDNGMMTSHGFMVNYKYDLREIEANNNSYVTRGDIAVSDELSSALASCQSSMSSKL